MPDAEGWELSWSHSWPWPPWATVVLVLLLVAWTVRFYLWERAAVSRQARWVLIGLRCTVLLLILFMLYGWFVVRHRTELPDLVVFLDRSASMQREDVVDERNRRDVQQQLEAAGLGAPSRFNLARLLLLDDDARGLQQLSERYRLRVFRVAERAELLRPGDEGWGDAIRKGEADGKASRLGGVLRDVLEAQRGFPTAAVVVLSDGVTTEGPSLAEAAVRARRKSIPLFVVGTGSETPPRDVRVHDLLVSDTVFVEDLVHFDFQVTSFGYEEQPLRVTLRNDNGDNVLAEGTLVLGPDGVAQRMRLTYRPTVEGEFDFTVLAEPLPGELDTQNNREAAHVVVRDETLRVLLVQEAPSPEFRFLKSLLERARSRESGKRAIELATVLQEADLEYSQTDETALRVFPVSRDELFTYDVILFGDANPSFLSRSVMEHVVEFVEQRGGGLVFLSGPRHTPLAYEGTPLEALFPFPLDAVRLPEEQALLEFEAVAEPTPVGLGSGTLQLAATPGQSLEVWQSMPRLRWYLEVDELLPGVQTLMDIPARGDAAGRWPLITSQYVGAGKVVLQGTDETYRWSRHPAGDQYYNRYWLQLLRDLSRAKLLGGNRGVEFTLSREQYFPGEPVELRVRFLDERLAPADDDGVVVVVESEAGRRHQIRLQRQEGRRGIFQGTMTDLEEGEYRAWLASPALAEQPASRRFLVVPPPGELARPEMDLAELQAAAQLSGGKFFRWTDADQLWNELPPGRQVRVESLPPEPVWNSPWLVAALIGVLVTEWILRKRWGMI